jgi:hypothetical protein
MSLYEHGNKDGSRLAKPSYNQTLHPTRAIPRGLPSCQRWLKPYFHRVGSFLIPPYFHRVVYRNRVCRPMGEGKCREWYTPARLNAMRLERVRRVSVQPARIGKRSNRDHFARGTLERRRQDDGQAVFCSWADHALLTGGVLCSSSWNQGYPF